MGLTAPSRKPTADDDIEDDWLEIGSHGSVKSLSTTDDSHENSGDDGDLVTLTLRPRSATTGTTRPTAELSPPAVEGPDGSVTSKPATSSPGDIILGTMMAEPHVHESKRESPPAYSEPTTSDPKNEIMTPMDGFEENTSLQDYPATPQDDLVSLNTRLQLLRSLLHDVGSDLEQCIERAISCRIPVIFKIGETCKTIQRQLEELQPIVRACADHWSTYGRDTDPREIPLNANLRQWIDSLRACLLGFQSQMDTHLQTMSMAVGPQGIVHFSQSSSELERLLLSMADFLPIIQYDYDEFRTKHMVFPAGEGPTAGNPRRDGADPNVSALRKELYAIRDETQNIIDILVAIHGVDLHSPISATTPRTISRLSKLRDAIVLILTNNYSEWIESDLCAQRQILPYTAFIALSPDLLQDVNESLKQAREELDVEARRDVTRQMIYNHQLSLLTEGGLMEELQSTANFLESLLMPDARDERA